MNIVIDGLSGVGKTYLGTMLAEELGIPFVEYLPDFEDSEVNIHKATSQRMIHIEGCVVEGSLQMSYLVKQWMHKNNFISTGDLFKCKSINETVKEYLDSIKNIYVLILDDIEDIKARRSVRGRAFEFKGNISQTQLEDLDTYILENYRRDLIKPIVMNRKDYKGDNDKLIKQLVKYIQYELEAF